ncbi:unnamed protein product [Prunus armeniaca]|uniref:Uncharacterized protein n=1 Tax=Prunus armeniaca TaxID=36596 RepID=A0A6J5XFC4_PRUAR|nr:unnamed protein product [Prunus armeniaca]
MISIQGLRLQNWPEVYMARLVLRVDSEQGWRWLWGGCS